jgi:GH24 family phage-related lysozyme (muramidase)
MNISEKGLVLIKQFEGLRLDAYQCSASVWSIGYGHTRGDARDRITEDEAEDLLRQDTRSGTERSSAGQRQTGAEPVRWCHV